MNRQESTSVQANRLELRPVRTQFLIFTLFGDYIVHRGRKIWTGSLLHLMGVLGVGERAVRSALSRMTQKGWLATEKYGRRSQYTLTDEGCDLLACGGQRIFEPVITQWDGRWHLVSYSLPESKRGERHALRTQLSWLGFGSLAPGTWISPHNRSLDLQRILIDLNLEAHVQMFAGEYLGPASARELVDRCWNLAQLERQYQEFIDRYAPEYQRFRAQANGKMAMDPEDCFRHRYWLTHHFQSFPMQDPNLPTVLLPADWVGLEARELFDNYRELLGACANQFVDEVMANHEEMEV